MNDSWPVVSWSGIDYYGNWKALHYQAKRAFAPVHINPVRQNDSLCVYLLSDRLESMENLALEMKVTDFNGRKVGKTIQLKSVSVPANTSRCVYRAKREELLPEGADTSRHCFMQLTLKDKSGHTVAETVCFFDKTKNLLLPETTVSYKMK